MTLEVEGSEQSDPSIVRLSASGISKFTGCEMRWLLGQMQTSEQKDSIAKTEPLELGTLIHRLKAAWWQGRPWQAEWFVALVEAVGPEAGYKLTVAGEIEEAKGWEAPSAFLRALKIMAAWVEVHTSKASTDPELPAGFEMVATELPFDLAVPGVPGVRVRGFLDGLGSVPVDGNRTHNRLRIVEEKTMGRWGREVQVPWDPQLHLYGWAAKKLYPAVDGALFEAISTYDYKQGGAERRFKRIWLDFDQRVLDRTVEDLKRVARRAKAVVKNPALAVRNVGDACSYCDHHVACLRPWDL